MDIADVHKNTKLLIDGTPYNIDEAEFMKPGKGRAIYRLKLRNLLDGSTIERTYHSSEKVEEAHTTNLEEQYLYKEADHYVFMNTETFEQHFIAEEQLGDKKSFLKDGIVVTMLMLSDSPRRALYLLTAPPEEMHVDIIRDLAASLRGIAAEAMIRSGDYPRGRGSLEVTIVLSELTNSQKVMDYFTKTIGYINLAQKRRGRMQYEHTGIEETLKDIPSLL